MFKNLFSKKEYSSKTGFFKVEDKEHISQQELADNNTGLTKYFIGSVERGEANPTLDKLILLAKSLDQKKVTFFDVQIDVQKYIEELNI